MFFHSIVLRKSHILHAPQVQCRPHKLRNRAFPLGLFPEVQFYCRVTQCFDVIEVVKTRHMHIVTIADFPKDHYLSLACWLRTCQWYPTTTLSACDLWKMNLLYSTNIFPLVYESSFQSVLSHIEDSGSSCLTLYMSWKHRWSFTHFCSWSITHTVYT